MVPAVIIGFFGSLENFVVPYCRPDPDIDREDHVRYCFKLEKRVREKDVQYKIVDNSILELSYMYRRDPDRRIVKKQLPKGNYADAELRGWLDKFDVFRVDISGFQREPTKKQQLSG
uniref:uncharacterized protein LOC122600927 n=1 Tax=Erigeron canadensis TaxID=72917 RepID=UPI001CB936F4|nr:uncharacterized protein LOC122600927 [Erigeron canadensis]